jgi:hypothetical protein
VRLRASIHRVQDLQPRSRHNVTTTIWRARAGPTGTREVLARVTDAREKEVPIVVDVDEIHTPEYEANPVTIEEEQNPVQEVGQLEEDTERTNPTHRGDQGHDRPSRSWVQCHRAMNQK